MVTVNLFFETSRDNQIEKYVQSYNIIRLKCGIQFKIREGWTQPYSAIVDTGAHTSVIPLSIWKDLVCEKVGEYKMFGISKKEECSIPVSIGKITCILIDESGNQTKELKIFAFLTQTDKIPLIIGFRDLLEQFNFVFNFNKNIAYVENG